MLLEKPAFSPKLTGAEAERKVSSLLKKAHWKDISFSGRTLFFVPYWFFNFDIYSQEGNKTKVLDSGFSALNAFSNELDDSIGELAQDESAQRTQEIEASREGQPSVVPPRVADEEAREIISVRLASDEETSKDNVIISGLQLLYVPIWLVNTTFGGGSAALRVNAVNGEIENKSAVPRRGKGFSELTSELIEELKAPDGWAEYSAGALSAVSEMISGAVEGAGKKAAGPAHAPHTGHGHSTAHKNEGLSQEDILVIVLAVAAVLAILWAVY